MYGWTLQVTVDTSYYKLVYKPILNQLISSCLTIFRREGGDNSTCGSNMKFIAPTNFSKENWSIGIGAGPTPLACTRSPQNGWSPKKGTIVVGHCTYWRSNITTQKLAESTTWEGGGEEYRSLKPSSCCSSSTVMHLEEITILTKLTCPNIMKRSL
jgi:hypothetical protein